ncbi:hypothetical protein [Arthrobacter crystallopoietes]|uniref:hypothetical protein n=1 Tax=Crystallibacter crystallopoietes TaxID=37928 RepID=UPI000942E47F|nr:hypothetical protein [Arthrobacter crystallopoietes]AUI53792.1 hypothetical protein AC20117_22900 [Arthrobacter crystallopoietes]
MQDPVHNVAAPRLHTARSTDDFGASISIDEYTCTALVILPWRWFKGPCVVPEYALQGQRGHRRETGMKRLQQMEDQLVAGGLQADQICFVQDTAKHEQKANHFLGLERREERQF